MTDSLALSIVSGYVAKQSTYGPQAPVATPRTWAKTGRDDELADRLTVVVNYIVDLFYRY
jgi:hypothetical protein